MPSPPKWGKRNCFHLQAKYLQFYSSHPPGPPESLKVHADSRKCSIFYKLNFSNLFTRMVWNIPPNMSGGCCCCSVANLCLILPDCSPPGSSVHGISQARILEWTDISPSKGSSWPRDPTHVSCINRQILFHWLTAAPDAAKSLQSCPTLCDPIDGRPPGSAIPGILQARILEWVAISFSNAWKWKVKVNSLSRVQLLATP